MYDIVIIGAGPAGATLAKYLHKKYKVLILDKRNLHETKGRIVKCCGGLLAPDAQKMLAKLGLGLPKDVLVGPQLFTVRTIDYDNANERFYQRHYINVDREKFDRWLVSLIPDHVDKEFNAIYKGYSQNKNDITVKYMKDKKVIRVKTKMLVGADGGFSTIRSQIDPKHHIKEYAAIEEWYKVKNEMPYFTTIFDSSVTDFYSWTIPKDDYLIVGTAVPKRIQVNQKFELLKNKLIRDGYDLSNKVKREGAYILRPLSNKNLYLGNGHIYLIGEAAGFISPSSAEGISYGLRSATALAHSINYHSVDKVLKEYHNNTKDLKINIRLKNLKSPFMYNKGLRNIVMKSGFLSMDLLEDMFIHD